MRPQLKGALWERIGGELRLVYDSRDQLLLDDPDGTVERLLTALRDGGRTVEEIATELGVSVFDVEDALALLDEYRLVEDGDRLGGLSLDQRERYFSNLAFFESFATLEVSREDLQQRLRGAHVLVLGTGGLNSSTIPHLCGLGIGGLTLVDQDGVEPRNFARQYLYRWQDRGARKVALAADWVRAFDPSIGVTAIDQTVDGIDAVSELIERCHPNVIMSGIDSPTDVDQWVNRACIAAHVPFVRAGIGVTRGVVWSVDPGNGACYECSLPDLDSPDPEFAEELAALNLVRTRGQINRGIGPVAGLLGSLAAFEVLRYVTGFEPPAYVGRPLLIDFANRCETTQLAWSAKPGCAACAMATLTRVAHA